MATTGALVPLFTLFVAEICWLVLDHTWPTPATGRRIGLYGLVAVAIDEIKGTTGTATDVVCATSVAGVIRAAGSAGAGLVR